MPFKVLYRGLELICETIQDVDSLADSLEGKNISNGSAAKTQEPKNSNNPPPIVPVQKKGTIGSFISSLGGRSLYILKVLAQADGGMSDVQLREATKIEKKVVFAGLMSAVAKAATNNGFSFDDVVTRTTTETMDGGKVFHYSLNDEVRKEILK